MNVYNYNIMSSLGFDIFGPKVYHFSICLESISLESL